MPQIERAAGAAEEAPELCTVLDPGDVDWTGVLRLKEQWLRIAVFFRTAERRVAASIDIPERSIYQQPLSDLSFRSCLVFFQLHHPGGSLRFEGKFRDGALSGAVTSTDDPESRGAFFLVQAAGGVPHPFQHCTGIYGISLESSVLIGMYEDHLVYVQLPNGSTEEIRSEGDGNFRSPSGTVVSFAPFLANPEPGCREASDPVPSP